MNLLKQILINNECYIINKNNNHIVKGLFLHSTGANNPNLSRYIAPDDGLLGTPSSNNWNQFRPSNRQVCVHAFIGKLKDGTIATYQTLPWDIPSWHSGSGSKGRAWEMGYIGVEICEDNLNDKNYFNRVYQEAVELFAYLCKEYKLNPMLDIICHSEGYKQGIASNHADVMHWFPKFGKSMDIFRNDVLTEINRINNKTSPLYRVQVGAFSNKENAEKLVKELKTKGYSAIIKEEV